MEGLELKYTVSIVMVHTYAKSEAGALTEQVVKGPTV